VESIELIFVNFNASTKLLEFKWNGMRNVELYETFFFLPSLISKTFDKIKNILKGIIFGGEFFKKFLSESLSQLT